MRKMIPMLGLVTSLFVPVDAAAQNATALAGTWTVTSTLTTARTCNINGPTVQSYMWIVSASLNGRLDVVVQGQTAFPNLSGVMAGSSVVLTGPGQAFDSSWFSLTMQNSNELVGVRRYMSMMAGRACFVDYQVRARRT